MRLTLQALVYTSVLLTSLRLPVAAADTMASPSARQALVGGVTLNYVDQGHGVPVVFVHGAFSDHRHWEAQRAEIAKRYRYIALDQRYFGNIPWQDEAAKYSVATHATDLAAFVEQLGAGPVHVVGWSYGGSIALVLAVQGRISFVASFLTNLRWARS